MNKYLIIGGAGFIGSYLVNSLIEQENQVVVIDSLLTGKEDNLSSKANFLKIDVSSPEILDVFKTEKPDIVYYLAGPINLRRKIDDPLFDKGLDLFNGFKKTLDYSHIFKVKKVVFVSSGGAVYSRAKFIPTAEKDSSCPGSLYGLANLVLEKILDQYYNAYNLNFITLRLSNVYGPRQWKSGVIPSFIAKISESQPLIISGDGTQTRDFIYITDVISALLIAGKTEKSGIFNIGSSQEISLNQLAEEIARILNREIKPSYGFSKETIQRSALDCSKMKEELDWEPRVSLEKGLKKTIDWQEHLLKDQ